MKFQRLILLFLLFFSYNSFPQDKGYIQIAYNAIKEGKYQIAVDNYSKSIETYNLYAPAYYGRGLAYAHLEKLESAINDFSNAIELEPKNADALYARGLCYSRLEKDKEALEDFDKQSN